MTIGCCLFCIFITLFVVFAGAVCYAICENLPCKILTVIICLVLVVGTYAGCRFYMSTASGQRALLDQKSELQNGIERTVTVYTANGEVMAQYKGKIDLESNNSGYVKFDYKGKRYIYYNCFVECISE